MMPISYRDMERLWKDKSGEEKEKSKSKVEAWYHRGSDSRVLLKFKWRKDYCEIDVVAIEQVLYLNVTPHATKNNE